MTSTAYTRNRSDQAATSGAHIRVFDPEPCRSTSGGASAGPDATTNVSPSRVGTRRWSAGSGQPASSSRYRCSTARAPSGEV
jgi:hypothetical protein